MNWYEKEAALFSPVISTRVRFARNLEDTPFPHRLSTEEKEKVWQRISSSFEEKDFSKIPFSSLDPLVKKSFVESRLVSAQFASAGSGAGLLLSRDGEISIMVNEEDHLRMQAITSGENIQGALEKLRETASLAEKNLPLAKREKLGYLTACPTNLGSACRISAMVHLPALNAMGALPELCEKLSGAGYTARGIFGEGSRSEEGILQISNQKRCHLSPERIAREFQEILSGICEKEGLAGAKLLKESPEEIQDKVFRAIGILRFAKKISYKEFVSLFSHVRFGKELGLDKAREVYLPDRFLISLTPAHLLLSDLTLTDPEKRDVLRATKIQEANP